MELEAKELQEDIWEAVLANMVNPEPRYDGRDIALANSSSNLFLVMINIGPKMVCVLRSS